MIEPRSTATLDSSWIDRTNRPIDLVYLARQTKGDRRLECEVLAMFERQISTYFDRVRATPNAAEMLIGLSTLKAASQGAGALALAAQAEGARSELERCGRIEEETLDDLAMAVSEVSAYILSLLKR